MDEYSKAYGDKKQELFLNLSGRYESEANPLIAQVFANLLSNAIKYSPEKTSITIDVVDEDDSWKVMVLDRCGGIKDEDKDQIFTRFKRIKKEGVRGTGLGLTIAKRIVELHDGEIWVEGNRDGGCAFYVRLLKEGNKRRLGNEDGISSGSESKV